MESRPGRAIAGSNSSTVSDPMMHPRIQAGLPLTMALGALLVTGCAALPAQEDPVQLRLTDIESRIIRIERMLDNRTLAELAEQLTAAQREAQQLRGDIETLNFELEQGQQRQRQQYVDLDDRLQQVERGVGASGTSLPSSGSGGGGGGGGAGQLPLPGAGDRANYQAAFELLKEGRFDESANAFSQFLITFADSPLADNAQYWLAETAYVNRRFGEALPKFQRVLDVYPDSRKSPDALLKVGYCNYELQRWGAAREALQRVVNEFGDTTAARLAQQRLDRMRSEGR